MDFDKLEELTVKYNHSNDSVINILSKFDIEYLVDNDWSKYPTLDKIIQGDKLWSLIIHNIEDKVKFSLSGYVQDYNGIKPFIINLVAHIKLFKQAINCVEYYSKYYFDFSCRVLKYMFNNASNIFFQISENRLIGLILSMGYADDSIVNKRLPTSCIILEYFTTDIKHLNNIPDSQLLQYQFDHNILLKYIDLELLAIRPFSTLCIFSKELVDKIVQRYKYNFSKVLFSYFIPNITSLWSDLNISNVDEYLLSEPWSNSIVQMSLNSLKYAYDKLDSEHKCEFRKLLDEANIICNL